MTKTIYQKMSEMATKKIGKMVPGEHIDVLHDLLIELNFPDSIPRYFETMLWRRAANLIKKNLRRAKRELKSYKQ